MSDELERIGSLAEKAHNRIFMTNGEPSILQSIKDQAVDIIRVEEKAGKALETAERARKYCGAPTAAEYKREGEICPMNEITDVIRFFKKRGKMLVVLILLGFFAAIGLFAWSGVTTRAQVTEMRETTAAVAKELGKINKVINP